LQQDVPSLGTGGDVVRVRPGYARNYLIPRALAVLATKGNLARVEELKQAAKARAERAKAEAELLAKKLDAISVKLERAAGAEGKMYGSVTNKDIAEAYAAQGLEIDRRKIELPEAIRSLGLHEVPVKIHPEVTVSLRVEVVKASS
jgi:large subunit ribosomal protein L9